MHNLQKHIIAHNTTENNIYNCDNDYNIKIEIVNYIAIYFRFLTKTLVNDNLRNEIKKNQDVSGLIII
jgi:hypothetical protein